MYMHYKCTCNVYFHKNLTMYYTHVGSVMYFVIATMADVDPMYQFSLKYFNQVFIMSIHQLSPFIYPLI